MSKLVQRLSSAPKQTLPRSLLPLAALCVLLIDISVAGMTAHSLWRSRIDAQQQAETTSRNLTQALQYVIGGLLHEADLVLLATTDEASRQRQAGLFHPDSLAPFLDRQRSRLPDILSLRLTDAHGIVSHGNPHAPATDLSDRDFFIRPSTDPQAGLVIGRLVLARIAKQWVLPLSRRIAAADGSFDGVVYANVALQHLQESFASLETGKHGTVTLFDGEGIVSVRYPEINGPGSSAGLRVGIPEIAAALHGNQNAGTVTTSHTFDGVTRVASFQRIPGYPLFICVGLAEKDYLAPWRQEARVKVGLAVAFFVMTGLLLAALRTTWNRRISALAGLAASQQETSRLQSALGGSEERYRRLFDMGNDAILVHRIDPDSAAPLGGFVECNDVACRNLGYTREELRHLSPADITVPTVESGAAAIRHLAEDGEAVFEQTLITKSGRSFPVEVNARRFVLQGEAMVLSIIRDISGRKALEEELMRSNRELEQFAYIASHDLRAPLRLIEDYLTLIERRHAANLDDEGRDVIHFAVEGAQRLDALTQDLLDYSRVGRDKALTAIALDDVLAEALRNLGAEITRTRATVVVDENLPTVSGSHLDLVRLFQNLIGNSLKYGPPDHPPRVAVSWREDGTGWLISVADNGIGIDPDDFERIFDIFQRLHSSTDYEGNGIGLSICRKIMQRHHGRVWVTSSPGQGSEFHLAFPVRAEVEAVG